MKQQITTQQINELSIKAKNKLHKWCATYNIRNRDVYQYGQLRVIPLLTIGHMIEFLGDNVCDALWEAVKKKLIS